MRCHMELEVFLFRSSTISEYGTPVDDTWFKRTSRGCGPRRREQTTCDTFGTCELSHGGNQHGADHRPINCKHTPETKNQLAYSSHAVSVPLFFSGDRRRAGGGKRGGGLLFKNTKITGAPEMLTYAALHRHDDLDHVCCARVTVKAAPEPQVMVSCSNPRK